MSLSENETAVVPQQCDGEAHAVEVTYDSYAVYKVPALSMRSSV